MRAIPVATLSRCLTESIQPVLIDVRRQGARQASGMTIEKSIWLDPAFWLNWKDEVAAMLGQVVFLCVHAITTVDVHNFDQERCVRQRTDAAAVFL